MGHAHRSCVVKSTLWTVPPLRLCGCRELNMSDPIDDTAGLGGPDWTGAAQKASSLQGADAVEGVEATQIQDAAAPVEATSASPLTLDAGLQALDETIYAVAAELRDGRLGGPADALEAVIERTVVAQTRALDPATQKTMALELREVLLQDPFLVLEIESLIAEALDEAP